ncbi:NAD(P)H-hydrate dehydratase [Hydrogenophaga atypica]|uniref:ADP-dependent (S)-NAD(P)H-hydrate dehydratase n=1 Tax=Hydrogenophaga atypica TaxID=249409 RepID=A0ABW2QLX9_9BURK
MIQRVTPDRPWPLFGATRSRAIEGAALAASAPHVLMARAGLAVAQWARALYPHARHMWVACGPGNNGGDGLVAACHLAEWAKTSGAQLSVSWQGDVNRLPADAAWAWASAQHAGLHWVDHPPDNCDLAIDALFGLGGRADQMAGPLRLWLDALRRAAYPVLCVDLPSGLNSDTGALSGLPPTHGPRHTLSLLTLKPGLFTAAGRDAAGEVWLDDLGCASADAPDAWLGIAPPPHHPRPHSNHKGSHGDVLVLGGQGLNVNGAGMTGAAVLAARAALHGGAGRVYLVPLDAAGTSSVGWDTETPELMVRTTAHLTSEWLEETTVVCGCGGGDAVAPWLQQVIAHSQALVLDADALNHVAASPTLQQALRERSQARGVAATVITPHPLEAARLLGTSTHDVQSDRLAAAQRLAQELGLICVLKGSGTVVAMPDQVPVINPTGNARLATAGTGDVLAGWLGARLAAQEATPVQTTCHAVYQHGRVADDWSVQRNGTLTASGLVRHLGRH